MKLYITVDDDGGLALWTRKSNLKMNSRGTWIRGDKPALSERSEDIRRLLPKGREPIPGEIITLEIKEVGS